MIEIRDVTGFLGRRGDRLFGEGFAGFGKRLQFERLAVFDQVLHGCRTELKRFKLRALRQMNRLQTRATRRVVPAHRPAMIRCVVMHFAIYYNGRQMKRAPRLLLVIIPEKRPVPSRHNRPLPARTQALNRLPHAHRPPVHHVVPRFFVVPVLRIKLETQSRISGEIEAQKIARCAIFLCAQPMRDTKMRGFRFRSRPWPLRQLRRRRDARFDTLRRANRCWRGCFGGLRRRDGKCHVAGATA